ncbi:MAG: YbdK family carboxylate-amine ligase [Actinomycetaceae bacterium]|nr:YbdK family carboxylate-amine ligase [Actinomycetaceae bacterium]
MKRIGFADSPRSTVGVEWEMQVIDQQTGELRQEVGEIERALVRNGQPHPQVNHEIIQSTLEITSQARTTIDSCMRDLTDVLRDLEKPLADTGTTLIASATHPTGDPHAQTATPTEHYDNLINTAQYWARRILTCGLHIHVGIEDVEKVHPISNAVLSHLCELQAVAANSPFWRGEDTGYASFRPTIFHQLPSAGIPPQFDDWDEYSLAVNQLIDSGFIRSAHNLFWDMRPAPHLGTLEVRIFDTASNLQDVAALCAIAHALVEHYSTQLDRGQELPRHPDWIVRRNSFASSRYGLDTTVAVPVGDSVELIPVRERLATLLDTLEPAAERVGCVSELANARTLIEGTPGYERQRSHFERGGFDAVIAGLRAEMEAGKPVSV